MKKNRGVESQLDTIKLRNYYFEIERSDVLYLQPDQLKEIFDTVERVISDIEQGSAISNSTKLALMFDKKSANSSKEKIYMMKNINYLIRLIKKDYTSTKKILTRETILTLLSKIFLIEELEHEKIFFTSSSYINELANLGLKTDEEPSTLDRYNNINNLLRKLRNNEFLTESEKSLYIEIINRHIDSVTIVDFTGGPDNIIEESYNTKK